MGTELVKVEDGAPRRRFSWLWLAAIASIVAAIVIVPVDLLACSIPLWVAWLLAALVALAVAMVWKRARSRRAAKVTLTVFGALAIVFVIGGSVFNPYWNSVSLRAAQTHALPYDTELSAQQARADLDAAFAHISKIHPALLDGAPQEVLDRWDKAAEGFESTGTLTTSDVAAGVESMLSALGDAHTYVYLNYGDPLYMKYWDQHDPHELTAMNGVPVGAILEQNRDKVSTDAPGWAMERVLGHLATREGLAYLGIDVDSPVTYTYGMGSDAVDVVARPEDFLPWREYAAFNGFSEQGSEDLDSIARYEIYPDQSLAVLTLDLCRDDDAYRSTLREMFEEVADQGIENVAVDLRENSGGNSSVIGQFMQYVDVDTYEAPVPDVRLGPLLVENPPQVVENAKDASLVFGGNVYVLTSPRTFSSAMMFAEVIGDNGIGRIIGEAPGNDPNGYGDTTWVELPESGLIAQVSTKKWHRIGGRDGLVEPDIAVDADTALDKLLDVADSVEEDE